MSSRMIGPHEGEELTLMLGGSKPLSLFFFESGDGDERNFPEAEFDAEVSLGRFCKRSRQITKLSPQGTPIVITAVLYSLANQSWRIDAYLFVDEIYHSFGPGYRPDLERIIGNFLGYNDVEIEAFIDHVRTYMAYA